MLVLTSIYFGICLYITIISVLRFISAAVTRTDLKGPELIFITVLPSISWAVFYFITY